MGLKRFVLVCVLWCCALSICSAFGHSDDSDSVLSPSSSSSSQLVQDGDARLRGGHRIQLLFPLLLRISTRLATLVPTALMSLMGILAFVAFSKKALIISLLALFLSISDRNKDKGDEIYIHKINSYPDYNDEEEHIHYHNWGPKYKRPYHKRYKPYWGHTNKYKRGLPSLPYPPHPIPLQDPYDDYYTEPFQPLSKSSSSEKEIFDWKILDVDRGPLLFPSATHGDSDASLELGLEHSQKRFKRDT